MKVKYFNKNILNIKLGQCYQVANESKASLILLKFLQSINMKKKKHEYKPYILVINQILKN